MKKFNKLLADLKKLNLQKENYVICGSGPLAIRNIRDVDDLDVIVTKKVFDKLLKKYPQDISKHKNNCLMIGDLEIGYTWEKSIKKAEKIIKSSEEISELSFMNLSEVIKFKKRLGRDKDLKDIKKIENFLK